MTVKRLPPVLFVIAGALVVSAMTIPASIMTRDTLVARLASDAEAALAELDAGGIEVRLTDRFGSPSRHAMLSGAQGMTEAKRERVAKRIAEIDGIGGVHWTDGTVMASGSTRNMVVGRCQENVEALLRARSVRFEESSASIDVSSNRLLDEVADALRPCTGAIVAIIGHTDNSGPEPGNLVLSAERASAVRSALIRRGIPRDGLRVVGLGSREPVEGLDPGDPANRRIEFTVISTEPVVPTPVDTPGAR